MNDDPIDIDTLTSLDPLELSTTPGTEGRRNLDAIIAYQRKIRAQREQGVRTRKPKEDGPKIDLSTLLNRPTGQTYRRR